MGGRGLFITGTDTGVGKTLVTAGLAVLLRDEGFSVGVLKPAETGCPLHNGKRIPADGTFLKRMADAPEPIEQIVPYRLAAPLAPHVAAEREGVQIRLPRILKAYRDISRAHDITLVEGAGGLLVPLTARLCMVDLAARLDLPVLLVGRVGLGTINHSLLSLYYLSQHRIRVAGVVLNDPDGNRSLATRSNPEVLQRHTSAPILGSVPFRKPLGTRASQKERIAGLVRRCIPIKELLDGLDNSRIPRVLDGRPPR